MTRGGHRRMEFGPQPRISKPRWKARVSRRSRDGCRKWQAARDSFRKREDIGLGIEVLGGKHLAGPSHPALHLIEDHQNLVFHGEGTKLIEKLLRRNQVPALALNRLENDSC